MPFVTAQVDPGMAAEVAKQIAAGSDGRSDTTYLAMICLLVLGIVILGAVMWLPKHINFLMTRFDAQLTSQTANFREEMQREREFHGDQIESRDREHREHSLRLGEALDRLTDAIDGRRTPRRKHDTPSEAT